MFSTNCSTERSKRHEYRLHQSVRPFTFAGDQVRFRMHPRCYRPKRLLPLPRSPPAWTGDTVGRGLILNTGGQENIVIGDEKGWMGIPACFKIGTLNEPATKDFATRSIGSRYRGAHEDCGTLEQNVSFVITMHYQ